MGRLCQLNSGARPRQQSGQQAMPHFPKAEIQAILQKCTEEKFRGVDYDQREVNNWAKELPDSILGCLQALERRYKYIVNCVIVQQSAAGLHASTSLFWDENSDGSCTYQYDGKSLTAIVTCYGLAV